MGKRWGNNGETKIIPKRQNNGYPTRKRRDYGIAATNSPDTLIQTPDDHSKITGLFAENIRIFR